MPINKICRASFFRPLSFLLPNAVAAGGHCDILALLLARQPNLAAVDMDGETAFDCAVGNGDNGRRCVLMLLKAGAPLDVKTFVDPSLCRLAVTSTAAIRALLDRGFVLRELRSMDDEEHTLLHIAAIYCRDADVFDTR